MRKLILLIALIGVFRFGIQAQIACGTEMNAAEQALYFEHQEERRNFDISTLSMIPQQFAVTHHIIRNSDGSGGMDPAITDQCIADLNAAFSPINLQFFTCGDIRFIDADSLMGTPAFTLANEIAAGVDVPNTINIYYYPDLSYYGDPVCGVAYYPGGPDRIFMVNYCTEYDNVIIHEMGHFLSLMHTHGSSNSELTDELVNGSNCSSAGDNICDTPADPKLGWDNVNSSCVYTGSVTDANGDYFNPDPSNFMSYARFSCQNAFTPQQYNEMAYTAQYVRNYFDCPPPVCELPESVLVEDITASSISVNWTPVDIAESYRVRVRKNDPCCDAPIAFTVTGNDFMFEGLEAGTRYEVKLQTNCSSEGSPYSSTWYNAGNFYTNCDNTFIPEGLEAVSINAQKANLSWETVPGASKYIVKKREAGTVAFGNRVVTDPAKILTQLEAGKTYEWKVRAKCSAAPAKFSQWSALQSFTMPECTIPENLQASPAADGLSAEISWEASVEGTGLYKYRYRQTGSANWYKWSVANNSVTLPGLTPNSFYEWGVKAQCDYGWTGFSPTQTFSTGSSTYSSRMDFEEEPELELSPNPARNNVRIAWNQLSESSIQMEVFDMNGSRLISENLNGLAGLNEKSIDAGQLHTGIYLVTVTGDDFSLKSKLVIVD